MTTNTDCSPELSRLFERIGIEPNGLVIYNGEPRLVRTCLDGHPDNEFVLIDLSPEAQGVALTIDEAWEEYTNGALHPAGIHNDRREVSISVGTAVLCHREIKSILEDAPPEGRRGTMHQAVSRELEHTLTHGMPNSPV
jgi:hypothetical protein